MSRITLNTNLAALSAQRKLGASTFALKESLTRLSSGLRINRAGDDAAGLSISESLNSDSRVFAQAIRNINDGISMLNIAEGALSELGAITLRQRELATQAANGTLSIKQRLALHDEANALVDEYNRIIDSVEFNGISLFSDGLSALNLQAGYGENNSLNLVFGSELCRNVGTGTFDAEQSFSQSGMYYPSIADLNGDENLDVIVYQGAYIGIKLGNGDGTLKASVTYNYSTYDSGANIGPQIADLNGDNYADIISGAGAVMLGNGDGSFSNKTILFSNGVPSDASIGDFNGDGLLDVAISYRAAPGVANDLYIHLGNGDGTFSFKQKLSNDTQFMAGYRGYGIDSADINHDGLDDIVVGRWGDGLGLFIANSDGSFSVPTMVAPAGVNAAMPELADVNNDGYLDIVSTYPWGKSLYVSLGNGDGTFSPADTYGFPGDIWYISIQDMSGDGIEDLVVSAHPGTEDGFYYLENKGDGTYQDPVWFANGAGSQNASLATGDMNNDGVPDVIRSNVDSIGVVIQQTEKSAKAPYLNLTSKQSALSAMTMLDETLERVSRELGFIGSYRSRLDVTVSNLSSTRENYLDARSRIVDADVASESAALVRAQILQQAGIAVLAQANQAPALALLLLDTE